MNKTKGKLSKFEIVWYLINGALFLWGFTYTILGLVADNLALPLKDSQLLQASNVIKNLFGLSFFGWGLILMAIAVTCAVVVLIIYAKNVDRDYEKTQRRAARLARNKTEEVVDAKVSE
mgnify:CR=1 FL=1